MNPSDCPSSNGNWWGEGDEKVFIDADTFRPSLFGTGTEGYFNFGWGSPNIFLFTYSGQTRKDGPGNRGYVSLYRSHIPDPLPFRQSVAFYLELLHHQTTPGFSYACCAYYYARPGTIEHHVAIGPEAARIPRLPPWMPERSGWAWPSQFYQAEEVLAEGQASPVDVGPQWAGGKLLMWKPARPGQELVFHTPVPEADKYLVLLVLRRSPPGGRLSMSVNDRHLKFHDKGHKILDLYVPHQVLSRTSEATQPVELVAGPCRRTLRYEGPSEGKHSAEIGVDFLWLRKLVEQ